VDDVKRSVMSVCLASVSKKNSEPRDLSLLHVYGSYDHSSPTVILSYFKVKGQCRNMRPTRVPTAVSYEFRLMAVVVGFHRDVINCELARRDVRRGAAEASGSCGVERVWAWQRGRSDLDPPNYGIFPA